MSLSIVARVVSRCASEDKAFWKRREETEEREISAIKGRLNKYHGGVFNVYLGLGSAQANKLRRQLEEHRVAYWAAREGRSPTKQELQEALSKLK
jgi:hypothetical protein